MARIHYRTLMSQHRAFMVYKADHSYWQDKRSLVKIYLPPGDDALERRIVDKLFQFQKEKYFPIDGSVDFNISGRETKHPLTKTKVMEFTAEIDLSPEKTLEWLTANTDDIPVEAESLEMGKEGWSVGPCITHRKKDDKWADLPGRFVRVRFNKMSIPFYITDDKKTWMKDLTRANLDRDRSTKLISASAMTFFDKNEKEIMSRVGERPFNKSGIAEYEPPAVSFYVKKGNTYKLMFYQGQSNKIDQSKLADPNYAPVVILEYRKQYGDPSWKNVIVAAIDDKLLEVKNITRTRYYADKDAYFGQSDLIDLDPEDQYVAERAARALRTKL